MSTNRIVGEVLVWEKGGVIEAEICPDQDYIKKKRIRDVRETLQEVIDEYNRTAAPQKKIYSLVVRDTEFEKKTTRKKKDLKEKRRLSVFNGLDDGAVNLIR